MAWEVIHKDSWPAGVVPNIVDYDAVRPSFSWDEARDDLDGLPGGRGLNIAHEAVDRHAHGPSAERVAFRFIERDGSVTTTTYRELAEQTNRFANVLRELGIGKGDRVFALLGRVPELYITILGTLKNVSVFCPLFSAFGPEPVRQRIDRGNGKVLVTSPALYRRKVAPIRDALPGLEHVILVGGDGEDGTLDFDVLIGGVDDRFEVPRTGFTDYVMTHTS